MPGVIDPQNADAPLGQGEHPRDDRSPTFFFLQIAGCQCHDAIENQEVDTAEVPYQLVDPALPFRRVQWLKGFDILGAKDVKAGSSKP